MRSLNRLLSDVKITFDLISDTVLRQRIDIENQDYFDVPYSLNNTYIESEEKPLHISIDDILILSKPGFPFFYEIHEFNNPENVIYSTRYKESSLKFAFDD